ncbi:MAG: fatty acid metabolism transcriptional regulator FadR [Archangium sp.]|nr:fatty acid metabolism transcriptional regulator FadR [Archangium sp.]
MRSAVTSLPPQRRPAAHAEGELVSLILSRVFPPDSTLPAERELALKLGVTRPTLREALQRLDRDGWIDVRHGKSTRVRDIWREGGLNVLAAVVRNGGPLPERFVSNLLEVRLAMAPAYARAAVQANARIIAKMLNEADRPAQNAEAFAEFDWVLHSALTRASENPVFTLILNGFGDLYRVMAVLYFEAPAARKASTAFYDALGDAARKQQPERAEKVTREAMQHSLDYWTKLERKTRTQRGSR